MELHTSRLQGANVSNESSLKSTLAPSSMRFYPKCLSLKSRLNKWLYPLVALPFIVLANASYANDDIPFFDRIDPQYQDAAEDLIPNIISQNAVDEYNKEHKNELKFSGSIQPKLIEARNLRDGHTVEIALYYPKKCENADTCALSDGYQSKYGKGLGMQRNADKNKRPLILFSHGGAFLFRQPYYNVDHYDKIANATGAIVAVPRYRLSSEAPFPAQLFDSYAALKYLYQNADDNRVDTKQIYLMGESAGGGLSAALALYVRDQRDPIKIRGEALIYPMLDYTTGGEEGKYRSPATGKLVWDAKSNAFAWGEYADPDFVQSLINTEMSRITRNLRENSAGQLTTDPTAGERRLTTRRGDDNHAEEVLSPELQTQLERIPDYMGYYSPVNARSFRGLPATFIYVGDLDLFANESLKYGSQLIEGGNEVELHLIGGVYHLFDQLVPKATKTQEYYKRLFEFFDQRMQKTAEAER